MANRLHYKSKELTNNKEVGRWDCLKGAELWEGRGAGTNSQQQPHPLPSAEQLHLINQAEENKTPQSCWTILLLLYA